MQSRLWPVVVALPTANYDAYKNNPREVAQQKQVIIIEKP